MSNKFSVVIPTMWSSDKINCFIMELNESTLIDDIVLIDNETNKTPKFINQIEKINHIKNNENIYVNPSWNIGVALCKNSNIIISNDDLCIKNIDRILFKILKTNYDLIGLDYINLNKTNSVNIDDKIGGMTKGFGCFFYIKKDKYISIPDEIKIWYGDLILHDNISNKGKLSFNDIDIELSSTVKRTINLFDILKNDKDVYERKFKG
jgi:hypothetical protein